MYKYICVCIYLNIVTMYKDWFGCLKWFLFTTFDKKLCECDFCYLWINLRTYMAYIVSIWCVLSKTTFGTREGQCVFSPFFRLFYFYIEYCLCWWNRVDIFSSSSNTIIEIIINDVGHIFCFIAAIKLHQNEHEKKNKMKNATVKKYF